MFNGLVAIYGRELFLYRIAENDKEQSVECRIRTLELERLVRLTGTLGAIPVKKRGNLWRYCCTIEYLMRKYQIGLNTLTLQR